MFSVMGTQYAAEIRVLPQKDRSLCDLKYLVKSNAVVDERYRTGGIRWG